MNERIIMPGDFVNWFSNGLLNYGKVNSESFSPVIEVLCLYSGDNKVNKIHVVQISCLTICK